MSILLLNHKFIDFFFGKGERLYRFQTNPTLLFITRITSFSSQYILQKTLASSGVRPYSFEEY